MNKPLISIIVPVYNGEKYLYRCLDSILEQTYENIEVIVVNDGSKDATGEICKSYKENNSKVVYVEKRNGGVSSARNKGIEASKGEYIVFVDCDDVVAPVMVEYLYYGILKTSLNICIGNFVRKPVKDEEKFEYNWNRDEIQIISTNDDELVNPKYLTRCFCMLINKKIIKNRFNENIYNGEDFLFTCQLLANEKYVSITDNILYIYYQTENSASRSKYSKKNKTEIYAWDLVETLFSNKSSQFKEKFDFYKGWMFYEIACAACKAGYDYEFLQQIRMEMRNRFKLIMRIKINNNSKYNLFRTLKYGYIAYMPINILKMTFNYK